MRLAGVAAIVLTFAGILTAGAAPVAALPGSPVAGPRLVGCNGPVVRPSQYDPICNDGTGSVVHLRWSSWGTSAVGRGDFYPRQCGKGGCVSAPTVTLYQVNVKAWRVQSGHYTRFEFSFPHQKPAWAPRSWVIAYSSGSWHGKVF